MSYPGPLGIAHCWAYLPDLAEIMVRLATRDDLADFETFHMRGQTLTGHEMVAGAVGSRRPPAWIAIKAMAPFNETMREMLEVRYLWDRPVLLDNARLVARLGEEPRAPVVEALRTALAGIDALPPSGAETRRLRQEIASIRLRCGPAALDVRGVADLHAGHARQDALRQDLGWTPRRGTGRRGDPLYRPAPHP